MQITLKFSQIDWLRPGLRREDFFPQRFFLAKIFPILKSLNAAIIVGFFINIVSNYFSYTHSILETIYQFYETILCPYWPEISEFYLLFILAGLSNYATKKISYTEELKSQFKIISNSISLDICDFGFREILSDKEYKESDLAGLRPFFGKYYSREIIPLNGISRDNEEKDDDDEGEEEKEISLLSYSENDLISKLSERSDRCYVLVDWPRSGKTMTSYQILRKMSGYFVISPRPDIMPSAEAFALLKGKNVVIFVDDVSRIMQENYDFLHFVNTIRQITKDQFSILATCRQGGDYNSLIMSNSNHVTSFFENGVTYLQLGKLSKDARSDLAKSVGIELDSKILEDYPLPGDITMRDWDMNMKRKFGEVSEFQREVLRTIKFMEEWGIPIRIERLEKILSTVFHRNENALIIEEAKRQVADAHFLHPGCLRRSVQYRKDENHSVYIDNARQAFVLIRDIEALLCIGLTYGRSGHLKAELSVLNSVIDLEKENIEANFRKGLVLVRLGNAEEALDANFIALGGQPESAKIHNNRSFILGSLKRWREALDEIDIAIKLAPNDEDNFTNKAIILSESGEKEEAFRFFETSLSVRPSARAFLYQGITFLRFRSPELALEAFKKSICLDNKMAEAYRGKGKAYLNLNKIGKAIESVEAALKVKPDYFMAKVDLANILTINGEFKRSIDIWSQVIEISPKMSYAYYCRGINYIYVKDKMNGLEDFKKCIELTPHRRGGYIRRAKTYIGTGDYKAALVDLNDVIEKSPNCAEPYILRGKTNVHFKKYTEAIRDFDNYIKLRPKDEAIYRRNGRPISDIKKDMADAYLCKGKACVASGDLEEARRDFSAAIEWQPQNAIAWTQRGLIKFRNVDEAMFDLNEAIRLSDNIFQARLVRGKIYYHKGKLQDALGDFNRTLEICPDNIEGRIYRARTHMYLNDIQSAVADFRYLSQQNARCSRDIHHILEAKSKLQSLQKLK